jgi:hypothetical protein
VVVAGREKPRWSEATRVTLPGSAIDLQPVGHLSREDASTYLKRAGVPAKLSSELARYAEVEPNHVHPFFLGLCADVFLMSHATESSFSMQQLSKLLQETNKEDALIDRLLRYVEMDVDYAVRSLSACRVFDRGLFVHLGQALNFLQQTLNSKF